MTKVTKKGKVKRNIEENWTVIVSIPIMTFTCFSDAIIGSKYTRSAGSFQNKKITFSNILSLIEKVFGQKLQRFLFHSNFSIITSHNGKYIVIEEHKGDLMMVGKRFLERPITDSLLKSRSEKGLETWSQGQGLRCGQLFSCNPLSLLSAGWPQAEESIIKRPLPSHQLPGVQVEARSPDRNEGKEEKTNSSNGDSNTKMYLDNEVSITTPLTGGVEENGGQRASNADGEGELSEVDITSQHNSVISQTPDSTISGPVPIVICETPGRNRSSSTWPLTKMPLKPCEHRHHHHGS